MSGLCSIFMGRVVAVPRCQSLISTQGAAVHAMVSRYKTAWGKRFKERLATAAIIPNRSVPAGPMKVERRAS